MARVTRRFPGADHLLFLGRFLRSPRSVGAIAPSSRFLAERMVSSIELTGGVRVVELGPGTGACTAAIARVLPADARFLGIDRESAFVDLLRERWPQHEYVCDTVENLSAIARARNLLPLDHIISGLPFASLPRPVTLAVLDAVRDTLRPGGTFTTFQYVHAYGMSAAREFRSQMHERFGLPASRETVVRNLPPALVLTWRKERA